MLKIGHPKQNPAASVIINAAKCFQGNPGVTSFRVLRGAGPQNHLRRPLTVGNS